MNFAPRSVGRFVPALLIMATFLMLPPTVNAQNIRVQGGNVTMNITTGTAISQPQPVVDASKTLRYRRQGVITKVTVSTVCPGQKFTLKVVGTGVTKGVAAPEVTLTDAMLDTDFVTDIPSGGAAFGLATLQYTASATYADGNSFDLSDDVHTVTYTLLAQ